MPKLHPMALLARACLPLALGGCNGVAGTLRSSGVTSTPDEFMVLPTRPLEMPQNLAALPPPVPGAPNRVDYQPQQIALEGLTGRPGPAATAGGAALVAAAGPAQPQIRSVLASEDAEYRATHQGLLLERLFNKNKEVVVYEAMILDPGREYEYLRARGLNQPPAPPSMIEGQ
jgi:hypothetical protein